MNKTLIIALALTAGALFNTADAVGKKKKDKTKSKAKVETVELKTAADSLSYAVGMVRTDGLLPYLQQSLGVDTAYMADFINGYKDAMAKGFDDRNKAYYAGEQIAQMVSQRMLPFLKEEFAGRPDSLDADVFNHGFIAALEKNGTVMPEATAKSYFETAFRQAVDDRNAATKKAGEDFLAANKQKPGVVTLPSGLQYKVLVKGDGEVATEKDEVVVKYEGRLIDGTVFDSSYERKEQTNTFRPNQVIKGWTEALLMMPVGSKWELYIPYDLAYGERQAGKIKPYSALVFTVEMVGVKKGSGPANAGTKGRPMKILPKGGKAVKTPGVKAVSTPEAKVVSTPRAKVVKAAKAK